MNNPIEDKFFDLDNYQIALLENFAGVSFAAPSSEHSRLALSKFDTYAHQWTALLDTILVEYCHCRARLEFAEGALMNYLVSTEAIFDKAHIKRVNRSALTRGNDYRLICSFLPRYIVFEGRRYPTLEKKSMRFAKSVPVDYSLPVVPTFQTVEYVDIEIIKFGYSEELNALEPDETKIERIYHEASAWMKLHKGQSHDA